MNEFRTRRPTGQASWPIVILAGVEGSGKTWSAVEASGMDLVDRAFFIEVGERMADEYGAVPGADFEIVEHDGTWPQILGAVRWAASQTPVDGKANLLIVDSVTEVWTLLSDIAQHMANARARNKGRGGSGDAQITMDLWNQAKDALADFLAACRAFPGPVILTARLDNVTVVEGGKPTGEHVWKIRGEKNLPYQATVILQARSPRDWLLTKIASTKMQLPPNGEEKIGPAFTIKGLFERMGVTAGAAASTYVRPSPDGTPHMSQAQRQAQAREAAAMREKIAALQDLDDMPNLAPDADRLGLGDELRARWREVKHAQEAGIETVDPEVMNDGATV